MPTPPTSDPAARGRTAPGGAAPGSAAPALRRHLLHLVLAVAVLDVAAIVVHRVAGVEGWPARRQQAYTVVWVALTLAVVSVFLSRIRATRIRARRARAGQR